MRVSAESDQPRVQLLRRFYELWQAELDGAREKSPTDRDKIARLRAELGWIGAIERSAEPAPMRIEPPCYFNTGCCSFPTAT